MADNINTNVYDKSVDRSAMVRLFENKVSKNVELIIDGHTIKVDDIIKNSKLRGHGYNSFKKDLNEEIISTMNNAHNSSSRSLLDLAVDQTSYMVQNFESAIGRIWRVSHPPRRVSEDIVLKSPVYKNITLEQGWRNIGINERIRLEALIRKGISDGLSEEEIALQVRKGNVFKITRTQSKGLVVTATTSVYAQVDHAVYEANKGALQGYQYVAVLDTRTTPLCAGRDGKIYPVGDTEHLPPAHFYCRSTTIPVVKSYEQLGELDNVAQIRKRNLKDLSPKQIAMYDGQTPIRESYDTWLRRQPKEVQLRHLGSYDKLKIFRDGQVPVSKFTDEGRDISIKGLRRITDAGYGVPNDTRRFALARERLDSIRLGALTPDDIINDPELTKNLREYYLLQSKELDGTLSYTNYRGTLLHNKRATRNRVLTSPPREDNLRFNPLTSRYEDARVYQPSPYALSNSLRLVDESEALKAKDKEFINKFIGDLQDTMSVNERAVITENLRITFGRARENKDTWNNLKAVLNGQMKFDVMNISDTIETQLRKDRNLLLRLKQSNYVDPVLGPVQLQDLHDNFIANIFAKNAWEDRVAPKIAKELRNILDLTLPAKLWVRLDDHALETFYLKFANRLSLADSPDRDQLAVSLGRDLYNLANYRGSRNEWYNLGVKLLDDAKDKGFYTLETFGVQKRRMKSRMSGQYFGPYYDTFSVNLKIVDPRIQKYSQLTRKVDIGLRLGVTDKANRLYIKEGYKTYFDRWNRDTRLPITSTDSFKDFPAELIDKNMSNALNWTAQSEYKIDPEFHDFIDKLMNFRDDKGKAEYYNGLNQYKDFMIERGDAYERFKSMKWLRDKDAAFTNHPFLDHRGRIYERGMIGPQSGESFRPFLNTAEAKNFSVEEFEDFQDQIGSFVGGLSDTLEGNYNSLSIVGRQKIAQHWRRELVKIGNHMLRAKPDDIRRVLESEMLSHIDGEDQGKVLRFALESAKIDNYLKGDYSSKSLQRLNNYKISVALEQDASSSGAQIIALTTKNKELASLSNVTPTNQKQRLYDEIASLTYNDPRFRKLNEKLGLTEKDLRKAAKAQNMVTLYGAGERTGILNVEGKLAKVLDKDPERVLVVKAAERDTILSEISARMARYEKYDIDMYNELKALRQDVKDIFNKGLAPGDDIMGQLYFLEPKTRDVIEKLSRNYDKIVTPDDFASIAKIMGEHLRDQVPVLKEFTRFLGRLAEDYVSNAKPGQSDLDFTEVAKTALFGERKGGYKLPKFISRSLAIKDEPLRDKFIRRIPINPNGTLADILLGNKPPVNRRTGFKVGKVSIFSEDVFKGAEVLYPNRLPKSWTNIPWKNFDGKTIEQNFTQVFEEKLSYKDADGNWVNNILQIPQKTDPNWWEEFRNKGNKINDIVDATKARTAFAVNGNHSNDAVIVKRFHLWGRENNISTSTVHDAFVTNAADMLKARKALRSIYADTLESNSIKDTLDEMLARGFPRELYNKYLNEAIDIGLIPVAGRSRINGKLLTEADILTRYDILQAVPPGFSNNRSWYGVG